MDFIEHYFTFILLLLLVIFFIFLIRRVQKSYAKHDEAMSLSHQMAQRQVESLEIQKEILNEQMKANQHLSDILKALKK